MNHAPPPDPPVTESAPPAVPGPIEATPRQFDSLLVANRGEVARRILRTAQAAGLATVAVYSDADSGALHVQEADTAMRIGPAPARDSYLDVDAIVAAATASGAQAVHPGYGFLAEDPRFARAVRAAGMVWVGPDPDVIALLGDKTTARRRMQAAGLTVVPGVDGDDASPPGASSSLAGADDDDGDQALVTAADDIGFPLVVKAVAGGGGTGMRVVDDAAALPGALVAARREAAAAFGDDRLLLERAVVDARHVEVQVLADVHGTVVAVGDRDCSVQRRHQKVIEEAPAPDLPDDTRAALYEAALTAARAVGYVGAGTVEFLYDPDANQHHFLEVNPRLQVEHPVTEAVTGIDLVDAQLRIAAGERLDLPDHPPATGHAIEARLYAEDPAGGFLPSAGRLVAVEWPEHVAFVPGAGSDDARVRVDAGVAAEDVVTTHYDPLLAKVIAHGRHRDEARRRLATALRDVVVLGVTTNRALLLDVLESATFAAGAPATTWLSRHLAASDDGGRERGGQEQTLDLVIAAAWLQAQDRHTAAQRSPGLAGWTNAGSLTSHRRLARGDSRPVDVTVTSPGDETGRVTVTLPARDSDDTTTNDVFVADDWVEVDGVRHGVHVVAEGAHGHHDARVHLHAPTHDAVVTTVTMTDHQRPGDGTGVLVAPMHGTVADVPVAAGDHVAMGDPVVVVEAMKMEHVVTADLAGTVADLAAPGTQVAAGDVLARISSATETDLDDQPGTAIDDPTDSRPGDGTP